MSLLFLDIETYVSEEEPNSGLNPFYPSSKVIVITYNYYEKNLLKYSEIKKPMILKEWEHKKNGEKIILTSFYNFLRNKIKEDRYLDKKGNNRCDLTIVGFNHIKFDLPYLFSRLLINSIDNEKNIFRYIFSESANADLMQLTQLISNTSLEKDKLMAISQKNLCEYFGLPVKKADGKELSKFYDQKRYDSILNYIDEEFTFERLYLIFVDIMKKNFYFNL